MRPAGGETERRRDALRVLAIFWVVTVIFFTLSAYKRRSYLLPLWPASALVIAWWFESMSVDFRGRFARGVLAVVCAGLVSFNFIYLPWRERRDCATESYRPAAQMILRTVGPGEPLYAFGFTEDLAPLAFYLDRYVTPIHGRLGDAPPGYVLVPGQIWEMMSGQAPGLSLVLIAPHGRSGLVLLSHGRFYARRGRSRPITKCGSFRIESAASGGLSLHDPDSRLCSLESARCRRTSDPPLIYDSQVSCPELLTTI